MNGQKLTREDIMNYNKDTGEISIPTYTGSPSYGLFGTGIAFPQDFKDGGGGVEPWVGVKRSIEQIDLMTSRFYSHSIDI